MAICANDPGLHVRHYAVFDYLLGFMRCGKPCYPSLRAASEYLKCSIGTVVNHINAIVKSGWLTSKRSQSSNRYHFNSQIPKTDIPDTKDCNQYKVSNKDKIKSTVVVDEVRDNSKDKPVAELSYQDMVEQFTIDSDHVQQVAQRHGITAVNKVLKAFIKQHDSCGIYFKDTLEMWLSKLDGWFKRRQIWDIKKAARKQEEDIRQARQPNKRWSFEELARGDHLKNGNYTPTKTELLSQDFDKLKLEYESGNRSNTLEELARGDHVTDPQVTTDKSLQLCQGFDNLRIGSENKY